MSEPRIGIIIGSASDLHHASKAAEVLRELDIPFEVGIASAHRTPEDVVSYTASAAGRGIKCLIAMAGLSAALPGVMAAHTTLPVIGVPIASGSLSGVDALYSIAQMPPGVPVASVGIDGAKNAALLAARIVSIDDARVAAALTDWMFKARDDVKASRELLHEKGLPGVPNDFYTCPPGEADLI